MALGLDPKKNPLAAQDPDTEKVLSALQAVVLNNANRGIEPEYEIAGDSPMEANVFTALGSLGPYRRSLLSEADFRTAGMSGGYLKAKGEDFVYSLLRDSTSAHGRYMGAITSLVGDRPVYEESIDDISVDQNGRLVRVQPSMMGPPTLQDYGKPSQQAATPVQGQVRLPPVPDRGLDPYAGLREAVWRHNQRNADTWAAGKLDLLEEAGGLSGLSEPQRGSFIRLLHDALAGSGPDRGLLYGTHTPIVVEYLDDFLPSTGGDNTKDGMMGAADVREAISTATGTHR